METKLLITMSELGDLLNCSQRTLFRLKDSGALPQALRVGVGRGGGLRFNARHIREWVEAGMPSCHATGWKPTPADGQDKKGGAK